MWRLLLSLSLLCLMGRGESKLQYMFSTPSMLKSGETGKICVKLQNIQQPIDLNVVLEHFGENITIISTDVPPTSFHQCNDVKAPLVKERTPVFISLSAVGGDTKLLDRKAVVIEPKENMYFIQMDKPIYKPGNTVRFRIISLNTNLMPVKETYTVVYIQDPIRSRMVQWKDQKADHGVLSFELKLIDDASPGYYYITAERSSGFAISEAFQVDEYRLPRFYTSLQAKHTLSVMDESLPFNFSSRYTYGKPVPGTITARSCVQLNIYGNRRNCFKNLDETCRNITGKLDAEGKFSGAFDIKSFGLGMGSQVSFTTEVVMTEEGTGIQTRESSYTWMTSQLANLRFDYEVMKRDYKRGLPYKTALILSDEQGQPIPGEVIELEVNGERIQELKTDEKGTVTHHIDTSAFVMENFTVKASYKNPDQCYYVEWYRFGGDRPEYPTAEYMVLRFYSPTGSFLQAQGRPEELSCQKSYSFDMSYLMTPAGIGKEPCQGRDEKREVIFNYLVMGRARILQGGEKKVDVSNAMNGTFSFDMLITPDFAPYSELVVYTLLAEELIMDAITLNIEKCFQNQVSLNFTEKKVMPGSSVDLQVAAAPMSLCGLRVMDSSLKVLYPYEQFNAGRILYSLPNLSLYGYNMGEFNLEEPAPACLDPNTQIFYNGQYYQPTSSRSEGDVYNTLKGIGLIVGTNVRLRKPVVCGMENEEEHPIRLFSEGGSGFGGGGAGPNKLGSIAMETSGDAAVVTVRKNFMETFMWTTVTLDPEGRATLSEIIPDTITEWIGSAFCVSEKDGFGMTRFDAKVTAFQPFFMEFSMPNSFTRGEIMVLVVTVANYLEQCIKVSVVLPASNDFTAERQVTTPDKNANKDKKNIKKGDMCICNGERAAYTWNIKAKRIGDLSMVASAVTSHIGETCDGPSDLSQPPRNDTVIQTVRVEAEGILKEETSSHLVCVQDANSQVPLSISAPKNIVPDSASAFVSILGDIMSLPLNFLENMIQLPTGCGEQTIARMAVIPPVLNYLNSTNRLTADTLQKAKNYLSQGYYRQLRFRHHSGCYTPFERSGGNFGDDSCNSWLTAKTFLVFETVKPIIFIDESIQEQALIFLSGSQQLDTGCYVPKGYLFWSQGEEEDVYAYTAMFASALLQSNYSTRETLLNGAMSCLKAAYGSGAVKTLYNKALIGFVFALAGAEAERATVLNEMKSKAISEGGLTHWERKDMPKRESGRVFPGHFAPAEVEIAAHCLLIMLKSPTVTQKDKDYMVQIVRWLIRQQNSYGSFRSTRDTVVALQALAEFGKLINIPNSQNTVRISSANREIAKFDVNEDNRLVLRRQPLPSISGNYGIAVSGKGCCLIQSTVRYNVPVPKENAAFALTLASSSKNCLNGVAFTMILNGTVRYNGLRGASNMAIIDVKLLSGYRTDYILLDKQVEEKIISKWEEKNGHLMLYFESIGKKTVAFSFELQMESTVLNVKSSSAQVYDYYELAENGYASYRNPCAA